MSLLKVVKFKYCYLHTKTNTDNMHIFLYLKKSIQYMGAISSEIIHLLKIRLSIQNDQRWLLLLSWFSNFFRGEDPHTPLLDYKI